MNGESTLSDALAEVDAALAAQNIERAVALANDLHAANPDAVAVWRARANALAAAGRHAPAADAFGRVLDILPNDRETVAALAREFEADGNLNEARVWARQALDYWPNDGDLKRIAAAPESAFEPDADSKTLRASLAQARAGLIERSIAGLQKVAGQRPDRADARVALAAMLWQNGARVAAAETCQALLDEQPDCLSAHLILLQFWRQANAPHQEQFHLQAIERVDPDHRVTLEMLGAQSPLAAVDVPAVREAATATDEDEQSRADWVADLIASSSSAPKPLERVDRTLLNPNVDEAADTADATDTNDTGDTSETADNDAGDIASFLPMEWFSPPEATNDRDDDFDIPWLRSTTVETQRGFVPSKPTAVTPDPRDGVPEQIEPLDWQAPVAGEGTVVPAKPEPTPTLAPSTQTARPTAAPDDNDEPPQEIESLAAAEARADEATVIAETTPVDEATVVKMDRVIDDVVIDEPSLPVAVAEVAEPQIMAHELEAPVIDDAPPKRKPLKLKAKAAKEAKEPKEPKPSKDVREIRDPADLDEALEDAQRAMGDERFGDAVAIFKKTIPALRGKRLDAVINDLQSVLREQPREAGLWNMLGLAYTRKGDLASALEAYRRAME